MDDPNTLFLPRSHGVEVKPSCRTLKCPHRDIEAEDLHKSGIGHQQLDEAALPATQITDSACPDLSQCLDSTQHAALVEVERSFKVRLARITPDHAGIGIDVVILSQPAEGVSGQPPLVTQVPPSNEFTFLVILEPRTTTIEKLVDLVVSHPIVLLAIQHRDEDCEVSEHIGQERRDAQLNVVVRGFAPGWNAGSSSSVETLTSYPRGSKRRRIRSAPSSDGRAEIETSSGIGVVASSGCSTDGLPSAPTRRPCPALPIAEKLPVKGGH